jgi:outer membrane protein assembly factor BamB
VDRSRSAPPHSIASRIRSALEQGADENVLFAELVSGGLSDRTARHLIERVRAEMQTGSVRRQDPVDDETPEASAHPWRIVWGALACSAGVVITAVTYLLARPGETYLVAYGAIIYGFVDLARGLHAWRSDGQTARFPWAFLVSAVLLPPLCGVALVAWSRSEPERRAAREAATWQADRARVAQEERRAAELQRQKERAQRHAALSAVDAHDRRWRLRNDLFIVWGGLSERRCEAALRLAEARIEEAIPALTFMLQEGKWDDRGCAADALVRLGRIVPAQDFYFAHLQSADGDLRRSAIAGVGLIGSPAVAAVPVLIQALDDSDPNTRFLALRSLASMGNAAAQALPAVQNKLRDGDSHARGELEAAIKALQTPPRSLPAAQLERLLPPEPHPQPPGLVWELRVSPGAHSLLSASPLASPAVGLDGVIYTPGQDGLLAIASRGTILWTTEWKKAGTPLVADDGKLYAVDSNGWLITADQAGGLRSLIGCRGIAYPALGRRDQIYIAARGEPTSEMWGFILGPRLEDSWRSRRSEGRNAFASKAGMPATRGKWSPPSVGADDTVYAADNRGELVAIEPTGRVLWSVTVSTRTSSPPAVAADTIYVSGLDRRISAVSASGARLLWTLPTQAPVVGQVAVAPDRTLYFGSDDGKVYAVDAVGSVKWTFVTDGPVRATPALAHDGTIYVGSGDGRLYALTPDGREKWSLPTNGTVGSPTVLVDGTVVFRSSDGILRAVRDIGSGGLARAGWPKWAGDQRNTGRASR